MINTLIYSIAVFRNPIISPNCTVNVVRLCRLFFIYPNKRNCNVTMSPGDHKLYIINQSKKTLITVFINIVLFNLLLKLHVFMLQL